jgi:2-keto-4-pentenoate hydratase/2-oxohepta-3-ene-1,7-dioic acid hydratase in catechol pathway
VDGELLPTGHPDLVSAAGSPDLRPVGDPLADAVVLAPLARPGKIFGSGINYASHRDENPGAVLPDQPGFFVKLPSAVIGPGEAIRLPYAGSHTDYEVELAVVIGQPGRDIPAGRAHEHILGFTVANDVSERIIQFTPEQKDLGKGCDTFCPLGPAVVTPDELDLDRGVVLRSVVNGDVRQEAGTATMLFTVAELVSHASRHITLDPGDVILTGTPAGCGTFRNPPQWLAPGDTVTVEVEGIGALTNPVVAGWR